MQKDRAADADCEPVHGREDRFVAPTDGFQHGAELVAGELQIGGHCGAVDQ